jgi:hypothetical protein
VIKKIWRRKVLSEHPVSVCFWWIIILLLRVASLLFFKILTIVNHIFSMIYLLGQGRWSGIIPYDQC